MRRGVTGLGLIGLLLGVAVVAWAHVSMGGNLVVFAQPEALAVVAGGTMAALLVSFPGAALSAAVFRAIELFTRRSPSLEALVPAFMGYARKAKREGLMKIERDIAQTGDEFLARALMLSVSGLSVQVV